LAKKRKRLNPNRFQKQDDKGLFSFDPIRRNLFMWGLIAGAAGGFFMIRQEILWQIIGVFAIVLVSNRQIEKASRVIPRWHAVVISFVGVMIALIATVFVGTIIASYFQWGGVGA